jgi:hypothetical protein
MVPAPPGVHPSHRLAWLEHTDAGACRNTRPTRPPFPEHTGHKRRQSASACPTLRHGVPPMALTAPRRSVVASGHHAPWGRCGVPANTPPVRGTEAVMARGSGGGASGGPARPPRREGWSVVHDAVTALHRRVAGAAGRRAKVHRTASSVSPRRSDKSLLCLRPRPRRSRSRRVFPR